MGWGTVGEGVVGKLVDCEWRGRLYGNRPVETAVLDKLRERYYGNASKHARMTGGLHAAMRGILSGTSDIAIGTTAIGLSSLHPTTADTTIPTAAMLDDKTSMYSNTFSKIADTVTTKLTQMSRGARAEIAWASFRKKNDIFSGFRKIAGKVAAIFLG